MYKNPAPRATGTAYGENSANAVNTKGDFDDVYKNPAPKATGTAYGENSANAVNTKGDFDDVYKVVHEEKSPK